MSRRAEAAPFGNTLVNARSDRGVEIDLALFGVQTGSFLDPDVARGSRLAGKGEVVISGTAAEQGIDVGDPLTLEPAGTALKVVGVLAGQHTFGHVDVAYLPLSTWQEIAAGVRAGDVVPEHVYSQVSAGAGLGLGVAAGAALSSTPMPFALEAGPIAAATALLIVLGLAGAAVAVVRIARVDPLLALGSSR